MTELSALEKEIKKVVGDKPLTDDLVCKVIAKVYEDSGLVMRHTTIRETHALMKARGDV